MKTEPCIICASVAELHVDDLRNHHITCPKCGSYIATDGFSSPYRKLDEKTRMSFAGWMVSNSGESRRFLYKTRPLKSNPYNAAEGFDMISITRIQSGMDEKESEELL